MEWCQYIRCQETNCLGLCFRFNRELQPQTIRQIVVLRNEQIQMSQLISGREKQHDSILANSKKPGDCVGNGNITIV